jgi:hypothetical protein
MPKRECFFTNELEQEFPFIRKKSKVDKCSDVICSLCNSSFSVSHGGKSDITSHIKTKKHQAILLAKSTSVPITSSLKSLVASDSDLDLAAKEATYAFHTVKHDQSFNSMDCTSKVVKALFEQRFSCARTKTEAIINKVLYPYETDQLKLDIQGANFVCLSLDTSGHGSDKILPVLIRYFTPKQGTCVKVLSIESIPGETSEILFKSLSSKVNEFKLHNKVIAVCADNTNTNFGGVNRQGKNNLYQKVKDNINAKAIGIGCAAHIVHNAAQSAADSLPIDVETIVLKVCNHFKIYTVRTELLKEFCEFNDIEYKRLLSTSNTRWLSLAAALERFLKVFEGLKSFFLSETAPPRIILNFFQNPKAELYLLFLQAQLHLFTTKILQLERETISANDVAGILFNLIESIRSRKEASFIGIQTKQVLRKLVESGEVNEKEFYIDVNAYFDRSLEYLRAWSRPFEEIRAFDWVQLNSKLNWEVVEKCILVYREKVNAFSPSIHESEIFEEFQRVDRYCDESKLSVWNKNSVVTEQRWMELFQHFRDNILTFSNISLLVEFALALPGTSAPVERVFSIMNNIWTPERNRLDVGVVNSIICIKYNVKLDCVSYYKRVRSDRSLLQKIHSAEKYTHA